MSGYSLISQILTEAEIAELGLHGSVIKHCSSPYIIGKKHFIKICVYYLLSTFLFFAVYLTLTILLLTSPTTELSKTIILVIYVYIFVFFYIDLILSNSLKYELVKRYNLKEVRRRIYARFVGSGKEGSGKQGSGVLGSSTPVSITQGSSAPGSRELVRGEAPPRAGKTAKAREKKKKKLFTSEKYCVVEEEQRRQQWQWQRQRPQQRGNHFGGAPPPPAGEEALYHLDELKNVNESINGELMKYIQYENNNYTIDSHRYDLFLIISGFVNQLNIFFDLLFLFYVYDYSGKLFSLCLFIYAYYLVHFGILLKFAIVMMRALLSIHRRSLSRSYGRAVSRWRWLLAFFYARLRRAAKRLLRGMLSVRERSQMVGPPPPKIFFSKYVSYNSWSFAFHQGAPFKGNKEMLKMLRGSDSDDSQRATARAVRLNRGREKTKRTKRRGALDGCEQREQCEQRDQPDRRDLHDQTGRKMQRPREDCEKALRPSHVQTIADMSSFLSHYRILNVIKNKFLSAHSVYEHVSFTLVFFVWKLLYMDVVLCLLKIFILFYTSDVLAIGLFLAVALANIASSYVINLVDNNLMSDLGSS
ncbi:conserved Plasmodium protein, unknown function [Plasmodium vivax]|uniref:(malaria parasite P. vivax) hypothetical protein n=1 Tax=Plasmodium vivax TaxID=5855 RepID=A0A1G4HL67_PLAVI|nr:unnamed protein product [Plasmodium vivax]SCO75582.1 conserved Plasmodium protein, unknown function [Plasmodium vivax]VUZ99040.1 conserved Plasmodium protein, unknown function [Plasmodium vivax]